MVRYVINEFEIKNINGEDVLYLYFDFTCEFGTLNEENKKRKLVEIVKEFLDEHKLKFDVKKISTVHNFYRIRFLYRYGAIRQRKSN